MFKYILFILLPFSLIFAKDNALISETSPYLLRHAHNPVNWYAWNDKTLALAKKEDKPIFLSIGYSTCHWCHIMEEESFEHQEVADILNKYFISIKVDREEFPNIDKKYQKLFRAYQGKRGGWPLSVFLTPKIEPYFMTTYMPRSALGSTKGIMAVTKRVGELYNDKERLEVELQKFSKAKKQMNQDPKPSVKSLELKGLITDIVSKIEKQYDKQNSGFATGRTKFPEASKIELLLSIYKITGNKKAFSMAKETLLNMSKRGIFDQIDGGFFRYSGKNWKIPHFQKLLYVNAQMAEVYLKMYTISNDKYFFNIAKMSIDEMERNYQDGLYFSASDSVSAIGEEGDYYSYLYDDVYDGLKKEGLTELEIEELLEYLEIEEMGNIDAELAHVNIVGDTPPKKLEIAKKYLKDLRTKRAFPILDKKIITSWNAMMIKTLFIMGQHDKSYLKIANKRLNTLLERMLNKETLYHQTIGDNKPTQKALLEDYAYLIDTLTTAYQVTLEKKYLTLASTLAYQAKKLFYQKDIWYMSTQEPKVQADFDDKYYSSALSILLNSFLTLANIHDDLELAEESKKIVKTYESILENSPEESASLVILALRSKIGVVTVKAKKEALKRYQKEFMQINYPFLLRKSHKYDEFMACKLGICFATGKSFKEVSQAIEKSKDEIFNKSKKKVWGK